MRQPEPVSPFTPVQEVAIAWVFGCFGGGTDLLRFMVYLHEQVNGKPWPYPDDLSCLVDGHPLHEATARVLSKEAHAASFVRLAPGEALLPRVVLALALGKVDA